MVKIVDTFSSAESFLLQCCEGTSADATAAWERYMSSYPELQNKCCEDHGGKWREIFASHVFPKLCVDREKMVLAHENLLAVLSLVAQRCTGVFELKETINMVIYLGLGNGAGWVTDYAGAPAILFGLENIADLNWIDRVSLEYLVAHELCHVVNQTLYGKERWLALYECETEGQYFRLYVEGFAERYQELLLRRSAFDRYGGGWLEWCRANHDRLSSIYLKRLRNSESVSDFYGNWNQVDGHSDVGYYLGREFIVFLEEKGLRIKAVATLPIEKIKNHMEEFLA